MKEGPTGTDALSQRILAEDATWRVYSTRLFSFLWRMLVPASLALAGPAFIVAIYLVFNYAPDDAQLGFSQKIFFFHLPGAIFGYLGFAICCVASIVYLIRPSGQVDAIARSGAGVGVIFCAMVLVSGPLWARADWGAYWTGEPRLTLTLALFVIFQAYVLVRRYGGDSGLTRRIGAVLAIFGFADIPLVRYAVARWGGNHPQVVTGEGEGISPEMRVALWACFLAFGLLFVGAFATRLRVARLEESVEQLNRDIGDRELLLEGALDDAI